MKSYTAKLPPKCGLMEALLALRLETQQAAAPVNLTAQSGEKSVSAKKRLKNLLYKPIILNFEPHSAQQPASPASPSETFFN